MDASRLDELIYRGRGKAAAHVGRDFKVFRPNTIESPFTALVTTLPVALNASDPKYLRPNLYGKPVWYADVDGREVQAGDYLVRECDGKTWFIAAMQSLMPIVAIDCNSSVRLMRQEAPATFGVQPYSGIINPADTVGTRDFFWPASVLIGSRPLAGIGLPADVKQGGFRILLPPSFPSQVQEGDIFLEKAGRRFLTESGELTDLGWRITVSEAHA